MGMTKKMHRPPLTEEEKAEKRRLKAAYLRAKKAWRARGDSLTDDKLGEMVAALMGRKEAYSQGAIWQFTSENSNTRIPENFVQAMAYLLDFPVEEISPRFFPKPPVYPVEPRPLGDLADPDTQAVLQLLKQGSPEQRALLRKIAETVLASKGDK